jgi:Cu/Ag efflux pump CusA
LRNHWSDPPLAVGFEYRFRDVVYQEFNPHIFFGGDNVAFWGPLSWTMIFGLLFGTVLTLILVPVMYLLIFKLKEQSLSAGLKLLLEA